SAINAHIVRWAMRKFKRLRGKPRRAWAWLDDVQARQPKLFAQWYLIPPTHPRSACGSRVNREVHARF
ncbi:MAG: hypothetical protein ACRDWV_09670, partial [Acidimicrobiales bacterium]